MATRRTGKLGRLPGSARPRSPQIRRRADLPRILPCRACRHGTGPGGLPGPVSRVPVDPRASPGLAPSLRAVAASAVVRAGDGDRPPPRGRRRDWSLRPEERVGAGQLRAGFSGRTIRPGEPSCGGEGVNEADSRAVAPGQGAARQHRGDFVARQRQRWSVSAHLHALPWWCHALRRPGQAPQCRSIAKQPGWSP